VPTRRIHVALAPHFVVVGISIPIQQYRNQLPVDHSKNYR
jgi:hypothetical protein